MKWLEQSFCWLRPHRLPHSRRLRRRYWVLGLAQLIWTLSPLAVSPSRAAEKITFSLGAIERSISVESLEIYAREGRITPELAPYIPYVEKIDPMALEQGRELLSRRADLDVTTVAQVAYTPQGEYLLAQAGKVFRTGARLPGGQGLRGAAIGAAADEAEGLTILNVIRRFPTPVLRVDIRQGLNIARQASVALDQSAKALDLIQQIALQSATEPFPDDVSTAEVNQLVTEPGPFTVRKLSMRVKAGLKPVDLYFPVAPTAQRRPAVVISHGLGNERETYAYLAQFLAGHGFVVISVEHPGSSAEQLDALVSGRTDQVVPDEEFISRPRLISQVLDELEELARFDDKYLATIDFNNIGVIGQSFGGYTALALGGAPLNLARIRSLCPPEFSLNISLLLQCQALSIANPMPQENRSLDDSDLDNSGLDPSGLDPSDLDPSDLQAISFRDPRIKAVIAINPVTSLVFGPDSLAQVKVPVMLMSGSADTVAPALPEQIRPFTWLEQSASTPSAESASPLTGLLGRPARRPASDRYLLVMEGGTHFSTMGVTGSETFQLPPDIVGPVPEVAQAYTRAMSLAFLSTYLEGDSRYQSALTSAFTTRFSQPEMPLTIVSGLSSERLEAQLSSDRAPGNTASQPEASTQSGIEPDAQQAAEPDPAPESKSELGPESSRERSWVETLTQAAADYLQAESSQP